MRRRLITILGIAGPFVLLFVCLIMVVLAGITSWWLLRPDGRAQIIRIVSLAPLTTPQAGEFSVEIAEPAAETALESNAEAETQFEAAETTSPLTAAEIEEALGFAVPEGAVNSITQQGLANRLVIPKLSLDAPIVISPIENQTWKVDHLNQAVGHLEGSAAPGSNSNIVLAGHVTLSAGVYGPFAGLAQLTPGDVIIVYDDGQAFEYITEGYQVVDRTAIEVTDPTETGQITLITCSNWDHNQGRYLDRLVVTGRLVEG